MAWLVFVYTLWFNGRVSPLAPAQVPFDLYGQAVSGMSLHWSDLSYFDTVLLVRYAPVMALHTLCYDLATS